MMVAMPSRTAFTCINESMNQAINESINQPKNQSISQV